jgi:O-6-methylguanine DNA methyltransferase
VACGRTLCAVKFGAFDAGDRRGLERRFGTTDWTGDREGADYLQKAEKAFRAYFSGDAGALGKLSLDARGTAFQIKVWKNLQKIPAGETRTYGEIARSLGAPGAARAVGLANNRNPLPIVIPCHRVIAAGGDLCGYGAGIDRKEWLLRHEGAIAR